MKNTWFVEPMPSFRIIYGETPKRVYLTPVEKSFLARDYQRSAKTSPYTVKIFAVFWDDTLYWDDNDVFES